MNWSDINWQPTTRTLRQFAGLWLIFFGGLACRYGWRPGQVEVAVALAALAVAFGVPGLVRPGLLRPVYVGSTLLAFPCGWTVSRLVLALVFFGLFTPLGLLFRLLGRDALCLRRQEGLETYWMPKPAAQDARSYFRQF